MTFFLFSVSLGFALGFFVKTYRVKKETQPLLHTIRSLESTITALKKQENDRQKNAAQWRLKREKKQKEESQNDLSNPQNQLRFVSQCGLYAKAPINRECATVLLYRLEKWVRQQHPEWRIGFEVGMGSFVKTFETPHDSLSNQAFHSYNSKRVDFLLIDKSGQPKLAVEYNGSGHDLDDMAEARMTVKKRALRKAGIPLLEIEKDTPEERIYALLTAHCP
ncbi:DUF2726 domain-containing protein [Saccharibacter floricola]|uniref:DUF2726 domain-containing protein n=1 Tax=Saccharibacter floricola DSM 15669 TaxID=1123227 RepID=A0ABQ0NYY0_9PROT|nr:DUF2726 domain-containing protein [Saccharibacter floricola]GBQ06597.1 hypothetical protein AA15669_1003 [Saccharibacter floricola DSM 15669]